MIEPPPLFRVTTDHHPSGEFISIDEDGIPVLHCHIHQAEAFEIRSRFLLVLAGWQSGKSSVGDWWLLREMRDCGPGNYLSAAPSFPILDRYAIPAISKHLGGMMGLGEVVSVRGQLQFLVSEAGHAKIWPQARWPAYDPRDPSRIIFGHAENPDSLAAFTGKAAWLDEPGQKRFRKESFEEIRGRLSTTGGRMLFTTRPYVFNWIKTEVHDRAQRNRETRAKNVTLAAEGKEPLQLMPADDGYEVVHFESIDNPRFSRAEWDQAKLQMPAWAFAMKYRGRFTKPAGAVYDCFEDAGPTSHVVPGTGFRVPDGWPISVGVDFGAPNFAAVFLYENMERREGPLRPGETPKLVGTGQYVAFAEYRPAESKTAAQHVTAMRAIIGSYTTGGAEGRNPELCVGGSASEGQWRAELAAAGWPINEPDQRDVEVGIGRVYAAFRERRLFIMDSCPRLIEDVKSYSRPVDEAGNVLEGLEDKAMFHGADSLRYIASWLFMPAPGYTVAWVG